MITRIAVTALAFLTLACESEEARYRRLEMDALVYRLDEQALSRRLDWLVEMHSAVQQAADSLNAELLSAQRRGDAVAAWSVMQVLDSVRRRPELVEIDQVRKELVSTQAKAAIARRNFERFGRWSR